MIEMKQVGRSALIAGLVAGLLLMASNGFADEIQNFNLNVTTSTDPTPYFLGQISVDTTTGAVDAINLGFNDEPASASLGIEDGFFGTPPNAFFEIAQQWCYGSDGCDPDSDTVLSVDLLLPVGTLVGYDGGPICSTDNPCFDGARSTYSYGGISSAPYTSGEFTETPEPSSLLLMVTGALGMCVVLRRKKIRSDHLPGPISI